MNPVTPSTASPNATSAAALRTELLSLLQSTQNPDGGWPFHSGGQSRVEPTCWAIRALADSAEPPPGPLAPAFRFLKSAQLPDGSWPANEGMGAGGWVTSLVCSILSNSLSADDPTAAGPNEGSASGSSPASTEKSLVAGLQWLCDDYPRDSSPWQKFLGRIKSTKHIASHNDELRGWGWTPRTASWVEPTAFALLAFSECSATLLPRGTKGQGGISSGAQGAVGLVSQQLAKSMNDRSALAIGLLYDRMCPRGGWNCGNPRVYGVDGDPLVLSTCWALLALRNSNDDPSHVAPPFRVASSPASNSDSASRRSLSLAWLQSEFPKIQSPASLAIATITLESYGLPAPPSQRTLLDWPASDLLEQGTHVAAWVALALNPSRSWPQSSLATRH